mgnify:CR=1 FL=1
MKKKQEYLKGKQLIKLLDEIYKFVDLNKEEESIGAIISYLLKKTRLDLESCKKLAANIISSLKEDRLEFGEVRNCILFRKVFKFENYHEWDKELFMAAHLFREVYTVYPMIVIVNRLTASKIDMIANNVNKTQIRGGKNQNPGEDEFAALSVFETKDFSLEFAMDTEVPENYFILVFDSDPNWDGGEPIEEPESIQKRKAA